jgi:hypothetical protein
MEPYYGSLVHNGKANQKDTRKQSIIRGSSCQSALFKWKYFASKNSARPRVFLYSSQNFHQQREVFVHQERTPTDLRLKEQGRYEYTSRSSAATTPDTVPFMLECRNSLKQNSEPCSKAKVPRTKIAATSTPPKSYLQLQESSKEANTNDSSYLPLELRVMIYEYVFYSESRHVHYIFRQSDDGTFTPRFEECVKPKCRGENTELAMAANANRSATLPQPMTALLRTCKQISNEGKPVFWKENGLAFIPDPKTGHIFVPFQNAKFLYHVPRVLLDFHHHEWSNALSTTARIFKVLGCLAEKERLKEVTVLGVPH